MISFVCVVSLRPNMLLVGLYIACFTDDFKVYQGCQAFKACSHGNVCMACYCSLLRGDAGIMPCSGSRDYWWCRCTGAAREVCWEQILATLNGGGFHSNLEASWCLFVSCTGGYLGDRMTLGLPLRSHWRIPIPPLDQSELLCRGFSGLWGGNWTPLFALYLLPRFFQIIVPCC